MPVAEVSGFVAEWILVTEKSQYEVGQPPSQGRYTVCWSGDSLVFTAVWAAADGQSYQSVYSSIPDGNLHPFDSSDVADTISTKVIDELTMDTAVFKGQVMVSYARRTLSEDGKLMTVEQQGFRPDGSAFSNRSVYERC